jgi:alkylhydroperoxidase family enzyme
VASTLENVAWESCLIEPSPDRELEAYARRRQGIPNPAIRYFAPVPWLARALIDLHPEYGLLMQLEQSVADLVALVVSQENSCRFCYAAVRAMLWSQGMSLARIQGIEHDLTRADLPPRTVAALAFGRSQSRSGPAGARAARKALQQAGFSVDEMKEIAYVVASTDFSNRAHTIPAVPTSGVERLPERLHVRLFRPLVGRILKSRQTRWLATPLDRVPSHPYAGLVKAYAGSPIAPALARTLEAMWASPHLTRRCKLLMVAVVARGLGCEVCGGEVGEALQKEGLTEAAVAQVLTHLDAPELDAVERLLVPFARETIWYEPALLQRRARALRDRLSGPQLLEAIGVAALANGLCRMGAMVFCEP